MSKRGNLPDSYEERMAGLRGGFNPGERVKAKIVGITRNTVFIDVNAKSEGIIERLELEQNGELTVQEGDEIEAFFTGYEDGQFMFAVRMEAQDASDAELSMAAQGQIPIEGRVVSERKGGFEIKLGEHTGFCPFSQIDLFGAQAAGLYIGHTFTFHIVEYDGDNLVVSRRHYLEQQREAEKAKLKETLQEGQFVQGTVRKVMDFGAFVDIGGAEGLVPASELSWDRSLKPDQVVKPGDKLQVQVIRIDWEKDRIALSLRKAGGDPWATVGERYHVGQLHVGKVANLMPFGAFVALEPGIEGLVHISKLGAGKRLNHANEVLAEGQQIEVYIDGIDLERKRLSLVLENPQIGREMTVASTGQGPSLVLRIGEEVTGRIEEIRQFGVFIKLGPKQTGLLHVSEVDFVGNVDRGKDMWKRFPIGGEIKVVVKSVHGDRIALGLPAKEDDSHEFRDQLADDQHQGGLGSLGSLFDKLNL